MPPEIQTTPPSQPVPKTPFHKSVIGLITFALLLCGTALVIGWFGFRLPISGDTSGIPDRTAETVLPVSKGSQEPLPDSSEARVAEVARLKIAGDYPGAVAAYKAIIEDPTFTPNQRARATIYVASLQFTISGDVQDLVSDIREMKKYALNPDVSTSLRVSLINLIGSSYATRNSQVFDAVYSGPTFGEFRVENDGTLSGRKLFEWSHSLKPTAQAAVRIARWYIETSLFQKPVVVPAAEVATRVRVAVTYMNEAKALEAKERAELDNIENSSSHLTYLYWYALESGYLARLKGGESFRDTYKQAYADLFAELAQSVSAGAMQRLPYAHYFFANALFKVDRNKTAAGVELDKAIDAVNSDPNPKTNQFVEFVKNDGIYDKERAYMRGMSVKFDEFLDALGK